MHPAFYLISVCYLDAAFVQEETRIGVYGIPPKQKSLTWLRLYTTNNSLVYFTERLYNLWSEGPVPVRGLDRPLVSALLRDGWDGMQIVPWQHSGLPVQGSLSSSLPELAELNVLSWAFCLLSKLSKGKQRLGVSFMAEGNGIALWIAECHM